MLAYSDSVDDKAQRERIGIAINTHCRVIIVSLVLVSSMGRIFCWFEGVVLLEDVTVISVPDLVWFLVLANFNNTTVCSSLNIYCDPFPALSLGLSIIEIVARAIASTISSL